MKDLLQSTYMEEVKKHLLRPLLYFDIFNYPLSAEEIVRYSTGVVNYSPQKCLDNLESQKVVFQFQNFYSLKDNPVLAVRRLKGNALASTKMRTAQRYARLVSKFPFVRAVMLSGSISKRYMDEESDIDYFIITEANRLWIVRTALALFRRIFLFNSGRNLCTNYFVDRENLEIQEKNIFTAIELCTTIPMYGFPEIANFQSANSWVFSFLPNFEFDNNMATSKKCFVKTAIEKVLANKILDHSNKWLMNKAVTYWKKKYAHKMTPKDFETAFHSTTGISKSHPQFFQKRVLSLFDQRIEEIKTRNGIDLSV